MGIGLVITLLCLLVSPAALAQTAEETSKAHWEAGRNFFQSARFREAIVEFEAGNKLSPSPLFELNMALAFLRLGQEQNAIKTGAAYCRANPQDADHEVCRAIATAVSASSPRRVALVGLGIGAGLLASAGALGVVCAVTADRYKQAAQAQEPFDLVGVPLADRYFKASIAGWVFLSVGAATTVLSVVAFRKLAAK